MNIKIIEVTSIDMVPEELMKDLKHFKDYNVEEKVFHKGYLLKVFYHDNEFIGFTVFKDLADMSLHAVLNDIYNPNDYSDYEYYINEHMGGYIYLDYFEIKESLRGQGYGSAVFNKLMKDQDVFLYSLAEATDFWEEQGFIEFKNEGYYLYREVA